MNKKENATYFSNLANEFLHIYNNEDIISHRDLAEVARLMVDKIEQNESVKMWKESVTELNSLLKNEKK